MRATQTQPPDPKAALRLDILKKRDSIPLPVRRIKDAAIRERLLGLEEFQNSSNPLLFASFRSEADTKGIIQAAIDAGKTVSLPRTDPETRTISIFGLRSMGDLVPGFKDIPEPPDSDPRDPADLDLTLMPGAAFDPEGGRLGYGMGCYDKLLGALENTPLLIALAYEEQIVEQVPSEGHDVRVDIIVTEKRVIYCNEQNK